MADLLAQIFHSTTNSELTVTQLQRIFQSLNGQSLNTVLSPTTQPPEIQIPLANRQGQSVGSLKLPIDDADFQSQLKTLSKQLFLQLTPKLEQNRISFQLNNGSQTQSQLPQSLSRLIQALEIWLQQPKPIIAFQKSMQAVTLLQPGENLTADSTQKKLPIASEVLSATKAGRLNSQDLASSISGSREIINRVTLSPIQSSTSQKGSVAPDVPSMQNSKTTTVMKHYQLEISSIIKNRPKLTPEQINHIVKILKPDFINQHSIDKGLNSIQSQFKELTKVLNVMPSTIQQLKGQLESIPEGRALSGKQLQDLLLNSGVFRERHANSLFQPTQNMPSSPAQANQSPTSPFGDIKSLFQSVQLLLGVSQQFSTDNSSKLSLNDYLQALKFKPHSFGKLNNKDFNRSALTEKLKLLSQDIEKSSARTRVTQFQNLVPTDNSQWVFELPLIHQKQFTSIQMMLEQDSTSEDDQDKKKWRVTVRFDFESLGAFHAIAELLNNQLNVRFVAERPETQNLLLENMPDLEKQLIDAGILLKKAEASIGESPELIETREPQSLVDYKI
ncbi:flagellar hook-length control protein FliK [Pleionea sediminis]|uniref:flagellar hook-length control protein FliK n=1 Tax=Pleionea sediminis TaxID=2569479 RepID=UPI001186E47D|nr:flagellar hook-length control protein FliK [Pleionea sediminis]